MAIQMEYSSEEHKLMLLYLVSRMELPMSRGQIIDFISEKELMSYFTLEETLSGMVETGLLEELTSEEKAQDENTTRYQLTDDGLTTLDFFASHISQTVKLIINKYIEENRGEIKRSYESNAHYFPNKEETEFTVKCGIYEDDRALLEVAVNVDSREQAKLIQSNWRKDTSGLYMKIIDALTDTSPPADDGVNGDL